MGLAPTMYDNFLELFEIKEVRGLRYIGTVIAFNKEIKLI